MKTINVLSGDIPNGEWTVATAFFNSKKAVALQGVFRRIKLDGARVQIVNQEYSKSLVGKTIGAAVGGALLGPVGLVAGALATGNKNDVVFQLILSDDRSGICRCSGKTFALFHHLLG